MVGQFTHHPQPKSATTSARTDPFTGVISKNSLGENLLNHVPMDVRESAINTVVSHAQALVIDSQLVQHGCVDVVDLRGVVAVQRLVAPLVAFTVGHSTLDPSTGKPVGKHEWIVITAFLALRARHTSKLGRPVDDRILKQTPLLQILDQTCRSTGHSKGQRRMIASHILMTIPVATRKTVVITTPDLDIANPSFNQPARDETLTPEIFGFFRRIDLLGIFRLWIIQPVHLQDVVRLLGNIQCSRC